MRGDPALAKAMARIFRAQKLLDEGRWVFAATSAFSAQAIDFASRISQRVVLINGKRLTAMMVEHGVRVRISRTVEFKRLDKDSFPEEG